MECKSVVQGLRVCRKMLPKFGIHVMRVALLKVGGRERERERASEKSTQWETTAALSTRVVDSCSHLQPETFPGVQFQSNYVTKHLVQWHGYKYPSDEFSGPTWKVSGYCFGNYWVYGLFPSSNVKTKDRRLKLLRFESGFCFLLQEKNKGGLTQLIRFITPQPSPPPPHLNFFTWRGNQNPLLKRSNFSLLAFVFISDDGKSP
jgi:hypothetical protein